MPHLAGKVYLVGAGPGDPELLTLRGYELIQQADVVIYDYLVNPHTIRYASSTAQKICLGSHSQGRVMPQNEINEQVIAAAQDGKMVVRLKGGDPSIFVRVSEEIEALESASVPFEVVPGVTTALAASSYAGIPLTHREHASCVAFVTGQQCRDNAEDSLNMANLASFPGTLVFYMGVTTAPAWASELMAHGKSPDTPVAIVRHCSLPTQRSVYTTLGELPKVLSPGKMRPPAIIIVGDVVKAQSDSKWFISRPLFGQRVLVTRPAQQTTDMAQQLTERGAFTLVQPAIEIMPVVDNKLLDSSISNLSHYDWLVFSSANGVHHFMQRIKKMGFDLRQLSQSRLAVIGPATFAALQQYHLEADLQPAEYRAEALAAQLIPAATGQRVLLLRANRGRDILAETLDAAGIEVKQVVVYQSCDVEQPAPEIVQALRAGELDWITVTSSAIARSLINMFGKDLQKTRLAAISPLTAQVLTEAGFPPAVVAREYTTEGMLEAMAARLP